MFHYEVCSLRTLRGRLRPELQSVSKCRVVGKPDVCVATCLEMSEHSQHSLLGTGDCVFVRVVFL